MRPAGRGPLESLYFTYPEFAARRLPALDSGRDDAPAVVVGAGPIGMTAALTLARYGVRSVLLDRKDTFNDGSRATCIARSSMQTFERVGAVEAFLAKSLGWQYGSSYYKGREIFRLAMPHPPTEKYLPMYNLQQQYMEQYLHEAVARSPLIDMRWQSDVTALAQDAGSVTLDVATPHGRYALKADYVLAADGARSPVRSMMGLRLAGENYEGRYVIADVRMAHDYPTERRAFFEPRSVPGGTLLIHKQPDDIWRIDYQLKDGESAEDATREDTIRARVGAVLAEIGHTGGWDLEWWSIYSANTLALDDYKHGRVQFIGDSAHIVPIFGVRGLNNGIADAENAGWKLAYVLNGEADPRLLDSYTPERRGATLDVFANASKSARFMTPPTRGTKLAREAVLSLALRHEFAKGFANPRQMTPFTYAASPLTIHHDREAEFTAGPVRGAASPNAPIPGGGFLLERAGLGFTMLAFGMDETACAEIAATARRHDSRLTLLRIGDGADAIPDPDGTIARVFGAGAGTVYLLRPDLHVAGRWRRATVTDVTTAIDAALGRRPA
jgi:3-(3-hydroxy-phenyl)propionate hydroxylase